ncbi:hypothetical protein AH4AK4_0417 [Aeromonas hydrophila 4AK4]|nr:hypothetical protein AH4AK4_0417 [Aeromonas hydrophila 4AK4]
MLGDCAPAIPSGQKTGAEGSFPCALMAPRHLVIPLGQKRERAIKMVMRSL